MIVPLIGDGDSIFFCGILNDLTPSIVILLLWACFVGAPELFRQLCLTGVESTEIELLLVAGRLELAEGPELEKLSKY